MKEYILTPNLVERLNNDYKDGYPKGKGSRGQMWCPYCQEWTDFKSKDGYLRAVCCGISESDYYVRQYNRTWK